MLFIFPNFYIINLPTIIGIQFLDGVGEHIVKLHTIYKLYGNGLILYIIDRLWKAGLLFKYDQNIRLCSIPYHVNNHNGCHLGYFCLNFVFNGFCEFS